VKAVIVADLGFGDSGKGTMTDYLVRQLDARLVVRFNGGAQAGHTVVAPDGRKHTFSQFGAGSLVPGVRTHLSRFMVVHPGGLLREAEVLGRDLSGVSVSPEALVTTPFHVAANHIRERRLRHGSCGLGVGETVADSLAFPQDAIRFKDLGSAALLRRKLLRVQSRKWSELGPDPVLESRTLIEEWIALVGSLGVTMAEDVFRETVVFEGAQGVLLDEWRGFHPHTTWSTCTFDNALSLLQGYAGEVVRLGVLRSYMTRHGNGPLPTFHDLGLDEPDNHTGPWQGAFRTGWADAVLGRYALACGGGVDGLAITHLDRVRPDWQLCVGYDGCEGLKPGPFQDLEYQGILTGLVQSSQPRYVPFSLEGYEAELGAPVWYGSWGPTCQDKVVLPAAKKAVVAPTA